MDKDISTMGNMRYLRSNAPTKWHIIGKYVDTTHEMLKVPIKLMLTAHKLMQMEFSVQYY